MIRKAITYGILSGVIVTVYSAILYALGMEYYSSWWLTILIFLMIIFFMFFFSLRVKREFPEIDFNYQRAFTTMYLIGMAGSVVALIWNLLLFNVIDPEMPDKLTEVVTEKTMEMMEKWGAPEDAMDQTLEEMGNMREQFTTTGQIIGWLKSQIFYLILAAIGALFIRRKETLAPIDKPL